MEHPRSAYIRDGRGAVETFQQSADKINIRRKILLRRVARVAVVAAAWALLLAIVADVGMYGICLAVAIRMPAAFACFVDAIMYERTLIRPVLNGTKCGTHCHIAGRFVIPRNSRSSISGS